MNRFRKSEKGFTLVELLIVVAIIGILAAIAIPQFVKYKRNAIVSACDSDLRNCMSEAGARYALNQANETLCNNASILPGSKFPGTVLVATSGNMTLETPLLGSNVYDANILVDADIVNGSAECGLNATN